MPRLLIAASGTGGHIFPALVVAETLPKEWEITWLGVPDRLEVNLVPKKYFLKTINIAGLQGGGFRKLIRFSKLFLSIWEVCKLLKQKKIQVVLTTGGYISVPTILSSKFLNIPVVLHESNAYPGKASRFLGWLCDQVLCGSPRAMDYLFWTKKAFIGTPVRKTFLSPQPIPDWVPKSKTPLLVVMGGSQGAVMLNRMVRRVVPLLLNKGYRVVHIIGKNDIETTNFYQSFSNDNLVVKSFSNQIPNLLQHAELVISRAGAGAISEFAICGLPAILVPFPHAADNHQEFNAVYAAQFGGAVIVHEYSNNQNTLETILFNILESTSNSNSLSANLLTSMSKGMKRLAIRDSEFKIIRVLENLL